MPSIRIFQVILLALASFLAADEKKVEARGKIESVTLYRGQALVTRLVELDAPQGLVELVVTDALAHVPEREREAFALHDLAGHSAAEVAEVMEIGASSVRSLLTLARRRLRDLLAPKLQIAEGGNAHE